MNGAVSPRFQVVSTRNQYFYGHFEVTGNWHCMRVSACVSVYRGSSAKLLLIVSVAGRYIACLGRLAVYTCGYCVSISPNGDSSHHCSPSTPTERICTHPIRLSKYPSIQLPKYQHHPLKRNGRPSAFFSPVLSFYSNSVSMQKQNRLTP